MQYRKDKYGNDISVLGYGCMRFTSTAGVINIEKAMSEIKAAFDSGINYYDTAYVYPGNEKAVGEIMERLGIRDQVNIATKLPHYIIKKSEDLDRYFSEQLKRLRTDHVDYYLMHMLADVSTWDRLKSLGIREWIAGKKESGEIRQVGFSYHGPAEMFCELVDAYDWDFCQIQYNYLDEHTQAGRKGLQHAAATGIPVVIMEPLRGGKLADRLPREAATAFAAFPEKRSPAEWGFRWLYNQPEVTCVLSGMNSMDMLKENLRVAEESSAGMLTPDELAIYDQAISAINSGMKVGCTGCRYCMPCPRGVDIPGTFAAYNNSANVGRISAMYEHFKCSALRREPTSADRCIGCGKCEQHCPQGIAIREELKNACRVLEGPVYRIGRAAAHKIMKY